MDKLPVYIDMYTVNKPSTLQTPSPTQSNPKGEGRGRDCGEAAVVEVGSAHVYSSTKLGIRNASIFKIRLYSIR